MAKIKKVYVYCTFPIFQYKDIVVPWEDFWVRFHVRKKSIKEIITITGIKNFLDDVKLSEECGEGDEYYKESYKAYLSLTKDVWYTNSSYDRELAFYYDFVGGEVFTQREINGDTAKKIIEEYLKQKYNFKQINIKIKTTKHPYACPI